MELADLGDPKAIPLLAGALDDEDAGVRQQAAIALENFDGPEAAAALAKAIVDPEESVAKAAANSDPARPKTR